LPMNLRSMGNWEQANVSSSKFARSRSRKTSGDLRESPISCESGYLG